MHKVLLRILLLPLLATALHAAPIPSPLFSDHAVLQRDQPIPIWGTASPGEKITVKYRGHTVETTASTPPATPAVPPPNTPPSTPAVWRVILPPMPAGPGEDLLIEGQGTFRATDVAVGDVWICSGQSNMEWPVETSDNFAEAKAAGNQLWLRELKIPHFPAQTPQTAFKATWRPCTPESVGTYSAVAYQFVTQLYPKGHIPVGILNLSYGGTLIEPWMSPDALAASPHGHNVLQRWDLDAQAYPALQAKYPRVESQTKSRFTPEYFPDYPVRRRGWARWADQ